MNYRKIKETLYSLYGPLYQYAIRRNCHQVYNKRIKINNLDIKSHIEGEEDYVNKWKALDKKMSPFYFRFFSHYIGLNPNIVPEETSHIYTEPILNPLQYRAWYEDKNNYDILFQSGEFPKTILRSIRGVLHDSEYKPILLSNRSLFDICSKYNKIVVKPTVNSSSGKDILLFFKKGKQIVLYNGGVELSLEFLTQRYCGDFIIQECIEQSDFLNQFNSTSVNTLRVHTYRSVVTNKIIVTNRILRIGKEGSCVDNAHAGGMSIGIKDGKLNKIGYNQWGQPINKFNNIDFNNAEYVVPNLDVVDNFCKKIASRIYHHRSLALDIALGSNNEPILIEYNLSGFGSWVFQFNCGPAYGDYADEIIEYCRPYVTLVNKIIGNNMTPLLV